MDQAHPRIIPARLCQKRQKIQILIYNIYLKIIFIVPSKKNIRKRGNKVRMVHHVFSDLLREFLSVHEHYILANNEPPISIREDNTLPGNTGKQLN